MPDVRRSKSALARLAAPIRLVWGFSFGAVRDFIWADLREGVVKLHGLSGVVRNLVLIGFALLFVMLGALIFNDLWRTEFPLIPMQIGVPGRGSLLPVALIPVTLFLLSVAWSFMLTGALRTRRSIKIGVLFVYVVLAINWISINPVSSFYGFLLGWGVLFAVPIFFLVSRWTRPRPALEFSILLLLVSATFASAQLQAVENWRESGIPTVFVSINSTMIFLSLLAMPFLFFIGMDIAAFTYRASGWASDFAAFQLPGWVLGGLLLGVFAWRLFRVGTEAVGSIGESSLGGALAAYAGALGVPVIVGVVWWVVSRYRTREAGEAFAVERIGEVARKAALPLILAYLGAAGLSLAFTLVAEVFGLAFGVTSAVDQALGVGEQVLSRFNLWLVVVDLGALVAAYWVLRRGNRVLALYLGILGAGHLWIQLTTPGRPVDFLTWTGPEPVDFWWVVVFAAFALVWLLRGRLTPARMQGLLFLLVITALLRQTEFIEDPFSPFFGFAGVGLIALGIVWDSFTIGSWANRDSAGMPRFSRIFLYLGYVLFSVAVINWVVAAHDLTQATFFTGDAAVNGLNLLGRPLLYAIFAVTLALPADEGNSGEPEAPEA